jgi:hypothetical protein
MANAKLKTSVGNKEFKIEGLLRISSRKSQQTPALPIPTQPDDRAVLTAIMGQVLELSCEFTLFERSDDYSNGTASVGSAPYSINAQKLYILSTIFTQSGQHTLTLPDGTAYVGRIQDLEAVELGDDPLAQSVIFRFTRGIVL